MSDELRERAEAAEAHVAELESDLAANASMLARQCDMAREAEARVAEMDARLTAVRAWARRHDAWIDSYEPEDTEPILDLLATLDDTEKRTMCPYLDRIDEGCTVRGVIDGKCKMGDAHEYGCRVPLTTPAEVVRECEGPEDCSRGGDITVEKPARVTFAEGTYTIDVRQYPDGKLVYLGPGGVPCADLVSKADLDAAKEEIAGLDVEIARATELLTSARGQVERFRAVVEAAREYRGAHRGGNSVSVMVVNDLRRRKLFDALAELDGEP